MCIDLKRERLIYQRRLILFNKILNYQASLMADEFDPEVIAENIPEKTHQGEIWPTSFGHKYVRDRGAPDAS